MVAFSRPNQPDYQQNSLLLEMNEDIEKVDAKIALWIERIPERDELNIRVPDYVSKEHSDMLQHIFVSSYNYMKDELENKYDKPDIFRICIDNAVRSLKIIDETFIIV